MDNSFVILSIHSSCAPLQVLLDSTEQTFYLSHNKTPLKCLIKLLVVCFLLTKKLVVILSFYLWIDVFSQSIYRFYVVRHKCRTFYWKTSIDELPQLFNVLKGDMSLIGPRPERPFFVDKFKEEIPRYMIKHQVRPGMTGWAQVNGLRGDTSIRKRIELDLFYIENWSVSFDIRILFLTVFKGFVNKNAY